MIEKEYKVILSKEQYTSIDQSFKWNEEFVQTNYYYNDADNYIYNHDITVRIREKDKKTVLQTKQPQKKKNALVIKEEREREVEGVLERIPENILAQMIGYQCREINKVGFLKTYRKVFRGYKDIIICLDRNVYLAKQDYELEIELFSKALSENVKALFKDIWGISFEMQAIGKNSRFFNEYWKWQKL